jgi:hypothetical protein
MSQQLAHTIEALTAVGAGGLVLKALWLLPDWIEKWLDLWNRLH